MLEYGLHCIDCGLTTYESIEMGAAVHGLNKDDLEIMLKKINASPSAKKWLKKVTKKSTRGGSLALTSLAAKKILEEAAKEKKSVCGLKVTAKDNGGREPLYEMDFRARPGKNDQTIILHKVKLFLDPESLKNLTGAEIDYVENDFGSGFKIFNPNFKPSSCCGGQNCHH
jgi:iron-sulfur cluster assembly accessory protein